MQRGLVTRGRHPEIRLNQQVPAWGWGPNPGVGQEGPGPGLPLGLWGRGRPRYTSLGPADPEQPLAQPEPTGKSVSSQYPVAVAPRLGFLWERPRSGSAGSRNPAGTLHPCAASWT